MALLPEKYIEALHHTGQASFYHNQKDRWELYKGKKSDIPKDGKGYMMWYETQLEAFIAYNHYKKKYKTALLGDLTGFGSPRAGDPCFSTWCIVINSKPIDGNAWQKSKY